ncbi:hypothetical protein USDA257_c28040 [Sinorhizobium fredii USDA 257]|uniref:DUF982 domain-containing protein n=1 Tax=Sinorhizobium fredii (strain USDA 257) TaxID=1185652 RepID=I3X669_SINF2|nr:hypothetical protein USDA257_c28040 [Sinorhizobium fredii USDA 257]
MRIRIGRAKPLEIDGPYAALNVMAHRWPDVRGDRYDKAKRLCMAALGRRVAACSIKDDFIEACIEADILEDPH